MKTISQSEFISIGYRLVGDNKGLKLQGRLFECNLRSSLWGIISRWTIKQFKKQPIKKSYSNSKLSIIESISLLYSREWAAIKINLPSLNADTTTDESGILFFHNHFMSVLYAFVPHFRVIFLPHRGFVWVPTRYCGTLQIEVYIVNRPNICTLRREPKQIRRHEGPVWAVRRRRPSEAR